MRGRELRREDDASCPSPSRRRDMVMLLSTLTVLALWLVLVWTFDPDGLRRRASSEIKRNEK
jgi:hypothetical protein